MSVGVVFASTGGEKLLRAIRTFRRMEPFCPVHVLVDMSTLSWKQSNVALDRIALATDHLFAVTAHPGYVNGGMNAAVAWMSRLGHSHACVFHDDLAFSHLPEHRCAISHWFDSELLPRSSGLSFCHFEALSHDPGMDLRRRPADWDATDLESDALWRYLASVDIAQNYDICPPGAPFFLRYEGPDIPRKWNRLGPTGFVIPIATWESLNRFTETDGVFYDDEYATECFIRCLPPVYAVTNFPYIHLHNQSVNPWADFARAPWGLVSSFVKRFGADKPGVWHDDWESRWEA
jgi:hypothetical protein